MDTINKIRAEIVQRIQELRSQEQDFLSQDCHSLVLDARTRIAENQHILFLINTLQEQEPKGLNKAAEEYDELHTYQKYDGGGFTPDYNVTLAEAFKAGAEWAMEQGETIEAEVSRDYDIVRGDFLSISVPVDKKKYWEAEKVIVQIRRKDE